MKKNLIWTIASCILVAIGSFLAGKYFGSKKNEIKEEAEEMAEKIEQTVETTVDNVKQAVEKPTK